MSWQDDYREYDDAMGEPFEKVSTGDGVRLVGAAVYCLLALGLLALSWWMDAVVYAHVFGWGADG